MRRVGLIGFGSIGRFLVEHWSSSLRETHQLVGVCVRPHQVSEAESIVPIGTRICTDIAELLEQRPSIVVEAAGKDAAVSYGRQVLLKGKELLLLSVGILADTTIRADLSDVAKRHGGRVAIPAGALAGFDGLLALSMDGLRSVRYVSTKPLEAWMNTPAEQAFNLLLLKEPTVIFSGNAGEAARLYPKNANLAAAVALAGIGFERTEIELIADPFATGNSATLEAEGTISRLIVRIEGVASSQNPKTSAIVGASVLSALKNGSSRIRFV